MKKLIITGLICLAAAGAHAGMGTTAAQFMKIGVGARPIAMGGAFGAVSNDANALYYNPAGIGRVRGLEILSTYGLWFEGSYYGYVGAVKSIPGLKSAVGMSAMYLGVDEIPRYYTDGTRPDEGSSEYFYGAVDMGIGVTWAMNLGDRLSIGVTGKMITETIDEITASAYDFDVGVRFSPLPGFVIGCAVQNVLESQITFIEEGYPLSRNIRAGAGYMFSDKITIGADFNITPDSGMSMNFGGEYVHNSMFSFRTGYNMPVENGMDIYSGLSFGGGLKYEKIQVDYALVPYGDLGLTHRISLTLKL